MRVCVFCGSSPGLGEGYLQAARSLGEGLARRGLGLVYGGAAVGTMGALADAALAAGGEVIGVMPEGLWEREIAHPHLTTLHVVGSMHERKLTMTRLSDAFAVLPGGYGTLDETFEALTWRQLRIHDKRVVLLNLGGFFDALLAYLDGAVGAGFIRPEYRALLETAGDVDGLIDRAIRPVEPA